MERKFRKRSLEPKEPLGDILRKSRESLRLSLAELAVELKIRPEYLTALESGNYQKLPADVYIRGFIKEYAKRLGLHPERALMVYKHENQIDVKLHAKRTHFRKTNYLFDNFKFIITPKTLAKVGIGATAFFLLFYLGLQFFSFLRPPKLAVISPKEAETFVGDADSIYIEGKTDPGTDVFVNDYQIKVNQDGLFGETVTLKSGVNLIEIKAVSKLNKVTSVTRKISSELSSELLQKIQNQTSRVKGAQLTVQVGDSKTFVQVWVDGKAVYKGTGAIFEPGTMKKFSALKTIRIKTGNAGAVTLIVANSTGQKTFKPLGKDGQVLTVEYRFDQQL